MLGAIELIIILMIRHVVCFCSRRHGNYVLRLGDEDLAKTSSLLDGVSREGRVLHYLTAINLLNWETVKQEVLCIDGCPCTVVLL